jgi:membrane protein
VVIVGLLVAIWAGLGATRAAQDGLNAVFGVPFRTRANFFLRQLRGLITLGVLGSLVLVSMVVGSILAGLPGGVIGRVALFLASALLNTAVMAALFKVLTHRDLTKTELLVGAIAGGVAWTVLQTVGAYYVDRIVTNATRTYGVFAVVIGLLSWVYLAARIMLTAAEAGTVAEQRLWPRAMIRERPTEADLRVADLINRREERLKVTERNYVNVVVAPGEPVAESVALPREPEQPDDDAQPDG